MFIVWVITLLIYIKNCVMTVILLFTKLITALSVTSLTINEHINNIIAFLTTNSDCVQFISMPGIYSWQFYSLYQLNPTETLILSIFVLVYHLLYHYLIHAYVYFIVILTYIQIFDGLNIMYNVYSTINDKFNKAMN